MCSLNNQIGIMRTQTNLRVGYKRHNSLERRQNRPSLYKYIIPARHEFFDTKAVCPCVEVLVSLENKALIAVIDDDSRVLASLQGLLESVGYSAASFSSAEAFLESRCASACRCVIADIGLPGMNGISLRRHLSVEQPDLPVILITAQRDSAVLKEIDSSDSLRFFEKPFDTGRLISAIAALALPMDEPGAEI